MEVGACGGSWGEGDAPERVVRASAALVEGEDGAHAEAVVPGHGGEVEVAGPVVLPGALSLDDAPPELDGDARHPCGRERCERGPHGAAARDAAPRADGVGGERDVDGRPGGLGWWGRWRDVEDLAPAAAAAAGPGGGSGRGGWAAGAGGWGRGGGDACEGRAAGEAAGGGGRRRRRRGDRRHWIWRRRSRPPRLA